MEGAWSSKMQDMIVILQFSMQLSKFNHTSSTLSTHLQKLHPSYLDFRNFKQLKILASYSKHFKGNKQGRQFGVRMLILQREL